MQKRRTSRIFVATLNNSGVGTYSLASPVSIVVTDECAEILVYTDSSRARLITRQIVSPVLFEF